LDHIGQPAGLDQYRLAVEHVFTVVPGGHPGILLSG